MWCFEDGQESGSASDMSHAARDTDTSSNSSGFTLSIKKHHLIWSFRQRNPLVISFLLMINFLRSFSVQLFLSPFGLDDFVAVAAISCTVQNNLLDVVHVSLLRAVRRHLEAVSAQGSQLASSICLSTRATISLNIVSFFYLKCLYFSLSFN